MKKMKINLKKNIFWMMLKISVIRLHLIKFKKNKNKKINNKMINKMKLTNYQIDIQMKICHNNRFQITSFNRIEVLQINKNKFRIRGINSYNKIIRKIFLKYRIKIP